MPLLHLALVVGIVGSRQFAEDMSKPLPDDQTLRFLLITSHPDALKLLSYGPRLFPAYHRLLSDKNTNSDVVEGIFRMLLGVPADRSQFLDHAIGRLTAEESFVRRAALALLAEIGGPRDTAPIAVVLSDPDFTVAYAAAKTLVAIGDERALAALNIWIKSSAPQRDRNELSDESSRKHIAKFRDELKQRLEKTKKPPGK